MIELEKGAGQCMLEIVMEACDPEVRMLQCPTTTGIGCKYTCKASGDSATSLCCISVASKVRRGEMPGIPKKCLTCEKPCNGVEAALKERGYL